MTGQDEEDLDIFSILIGKFCKVVYDDSGKTSISKGILKGSDKNFVYIKGDYSESIIPKSKIIRLNRILDGKDYFEDKKK